MNFLLDTNILVHLIRRSPVAEKVINELNPFGATNIPLISVVSYAEIFDHLDKVFIDVIKMSE